LTDAVTDLAPIAVFGGTFDPIHNGHLRSALELAERLQLAEVRMMPSATPPHRGMPAASPERRAAMLELAVAGEPLLCCDRRELCRDGPSYTVDSLIELRSELGQARSICLVMGCDAVLGINQWHRWDEILDLTHVVVIARPGWQFPQEGDAARWLKENTVEDATSLGASPAGSVRVVELRPLPISATEIREMRRAGLSMRFLLPEPVLDYIVKHNLYE
jgi:nicotinate-nucleotide adenylyltransferase